MELDNVTDSNFKAEVLDSSVPVLVDFWAVWCGPCRMLGPTLEKVAESMGDKVRIVKINIDENPDVAANYRIQNIPYMGLFKDGDLAGSLIGNQPKTKIETWLKDHI